jgi:hypothetical protein
MSCRVRTPPGGQIGVSIVVEDNIDNQYDSEARNNKIRKNTISNFQADIQDEGSATTLDPANP